MDQATRPGGMRDIAQLIDARPLNGFQIRVILLCCLTVLLDGYDIQTMALVVPSLAQEWGIPASGFGIALVLGGLLISLAVDKDKTGSALLCAYALAAASLAAFALLPPTPLVWNLLLVVLGAGISGSQLALYALAAGFYPPALRATGLGWSTGVGRFGAMAGPVAGGLLIQLQLGTTATLGLLAVPLFLCALGAWRMANPGRTSSIRHTPQ